VTRIRVVFSTPSGSSAGPERPLGSTSAAAVRRESQVRERFNRERLEVIVGWGAGSVEEFPKVYPEYGPVEATGGEAGAPSTRSPDAD